jgi:hypothetical protein
MKPIAAALLILLGINPPALPDDSDFEFTVSGALAAKLEPDTAIQIWSPVTETRPDWALFSVKKLPYKVPFKQLHAGHIWLASFHSLSQREVVFSMGLSPDLFDKPRRIDLKLDPPKPRIRPGYLGRLDFWYYSGITQRMWYESLPFWDAKSQKLVKAKPPVMTILRASDGVILKQSAMEEGCMGSKWYARLDRSLDLGLKTELRLVVRYDSGGLWEPMETKLNFTYDKSRDRQ